MREVLAWFRATMNWEYLLVLGVGQCALSLAMIDLGMGLYVRVMICIAYSILPGAVACLVRRPQ